MGTRVMPGDIVRVGKKIVSPRAPEVVLFNKPRGLVCSASDELGRETIYAVIPQKYQHLKNVGRLDMDSEGIIVLTNDGELAQTLTHPRQKIEKEYLVTLDQSFDNEVLEKLLTGVHTSEGRLTAKSVKRVSSRRVRVVLVTGVKRQIRIMFEALHLKVTKLVRIRIGSLMGNALEVGKCHPLDEEDIELLKTNPKESRTSRAGSGESFQKSAKHSGKNVAKKSTRKSSKRPAPYMPARKSSKAPKGRRK